MSLHPTFENYVQNYEYEREIMFFFKNLTPYHAIQYEFVRRPITFLGFSDNQSGWLRYQWFPLRRFLLQNVPRILCSNSLGPL